MTLPPNVVLTPTQQTARDERQRVLAKLFDDLDEIRTQLIVGGAPASLVRRLAGTSDHLRDMCRVPRAAAAAATPRAIPVNEPAGGEDALAAMTANARAAFETTLQQPAAKSKGPKP